jgi:cobalt-zinc-cadmium efflux system membrane fusion protein
MNSNRPLILLGLFLILLAPAGAMAQHDDHDDHEDSGSAVHLDQATLDEFGIVTAVVGPDTLRTYRSLPGEVRPNAERIAHLVPRYDGIVREVHTRIGDNVKAGDVLAVIESDASLTDFNVSAALGGTVIQRHISLGEAVSRDQTLFVVADLDTVWIEIAIYLRDLETVDTGLPVNLSCGRHDAVTPAVIGYVSPVVDEATRTATARVTMPNHDRHWRPGMFVTADVEISAEEVALSVPQTALFTIDGHQVVFVQTDEGFTPHEVTVGHRAGGLVEILGGLVHPRS